MSSPQPPTDADYAALRPRYQGELAKGVERFLEPRRETCPWCGSDALATRGRTQDLIQRKPGRFVMDVCRTCGHVFQNPRLTPEGLSFYYADFYDGLGQHVMEPVFDGALGYNHQRAELVKGELAKSGTAPKRWLDVGTGYGYFAKHAREVLPDTTFDGLDMGVAVTIGEERGWLDKGHQGMFPELAESLAGQYDVLSMHHYLEHTRDPRAELDAAARVLTPGDLFLIEMPDPCYRLAKAYGKWWMPLLQPQHQHMIPMRNLLQALAERGFTPVATVSGHAHMSVDTTWAFVQMFAVAAPDPRMPWLPKEPNAFRRKRHEIAWKKVAPKFFKFGHKVDQKLTALAHRTDNGNTYRVLARKDAR
jgi:SAM-dependent methyltransferase